MFPLDVPHVENCALIAKVPGDKLWYLGYGNLHVNGLKLLVQKDMVIDLPKVDSLGFCEGCVYGEHIRQSFLMKNFKMYRSGSCLFKCSYAYWFFWCIFYILKMTTLV